MAGHNNGNKSAVMSTNPVLSPVCLLPLRTFSLFYCLRMAWISETFSTCADEHTFREKFWVRCTKRVTLPSPINSQRWLRFEKETKF